MRLTGLNKFVNASTHSRQLRGALILIAPLSALSCASFLSVRHSNVSHCIWCIVLAASPLTKCARCLTAWWSITESGVPSGACKRMRDRKSAIISGTCCCGISVYVCWWCKMPYICCIFNTVVVVACVIFIPGFSQCRGYWV